MRLKAARRPDRERGSMSVELAAVVPALALLLLLVALAGDFVEAQGKVDGAARDAARAASMARYSGTGSLGADSLAAQAANGDLAGRCVGAVGVTVAGFPGAGQQAQAGDTVTVTINCSIDTSIFGVFNLGATHDVTGIAAAPLDPLMCRGTAC